MRLHVLIVSSFCISAIALQKKHVHRVGQEDKYTTCLVSYSLNDERPEESLLIQPSAIVNYKSSREIGFTSAEFVNRTKKAKKNHRRESPRSREIF